MKITFAHRFRGPLTSANGGYACGRLAAFVDADEVEVTLRVPPPLDRLLTVERTEHGVDLMDGDVLIAEARASRVDLDLLEPVSIEDAHVARDRHVRGADEQFNECFVCGVRKDGLGVRVGLVPGHEPLYAAPLVLDDPAPEIVWAAIDCPGAYATGAEGRGDLVLGRMSARVKRVPEAAEECVVVAWPIGVDGRKHFAGTALFAAAGELLALARQTWIAPRS